MGFPPQPPQPQSGPQGPWDAQGHGAQHGQGPGPGGQPPQGHGQTTPQQPGYGPPTGQGGYGASQAPGGGNPQGGYDPPTAPVSPYGPPGYSGPVPYGSPPEQPNKALIISLVAAVAVVLVAGGGYGVYAYLNRDPAPTVAQQTPSSPASDPPSSASADPTTDPPSQATAQPTEPTTQPTTQPTTEPTTEPTTQASTDSGAADRPEPGSPITHGEFPDWKFSLGGAKFAADKVGGWTYDSCDGLDGKGELAEHNCERAVELAYSAYAGHLKAVQVIMTFPDETAAKTASTRLNKLPSNALKWRRDQVLDTFDYGKIRSGTVKNYVVLTVVTADKTARSKATKFHHYLQADHKNYFLFRDL